MTFPELDLDGRVALVTGGDQGQRQISGRTPKAKLGLPS